MTSKSAASSSSPWRWLRWVLLAVVIVGGFAACFFMAAIRPHKNVMRFEPNYPKRNPNPVRTVSIAGTIPPGLQIKFLARYAASRGDDSCNRSMPLTPGFPLHLVEPLDDVRAGSAYRFSVTVDKYQPGACSWTLEFVGYQLLDKDPVLDREEGFETGGVPIAYFSGEDRLPAPKSWRGRVDLWCYKGPIGHGMQTPEVCGVFGGFVGDVFQALRSKGQEGSNAITWIFPDSSSAEVNFRDLNVLVTQHAKAK
jgi:hypothetical protein